MSTGPSDEADGANAGEALDAFGSHPEWPERVASDRLDRLIERFPTSEVIDAVLARLGDLSGLQGEVLLRLVEANPGSVLPRALAEALVPQADLPAERLWDALSVLDGSGILEEYPSLREAWDDLNETLDDEGSIGELSEQIESDPDGVWLGVQGLGAVEAEVRPQIIAGLANGPIGPGVAEFLRLLAYAGDPETRLPALEVLAAAPDSAQTQRVWSDLSDRHDDPEVREAARSRLKEKADVPAVVRGTGLAVSSPRVVRSLVTAVDGRGRARIVLSAERGAGRATALFVCELSRGVSEVHGEISRRSGSADSLTEVFLDDLDAEVVEDVHSLALGLLAGCLTLASPTSPPALRFWMEATAGPDLEPKPFRAGFPDFDPSGVPRHEIAARASAVLERCPDWRDTSPLTYELAEEIRLREGDAPPDPGRDAGAYRFLFEHRLADRLEDYRRMLLWMAWFWRARGEEALGESALVLAYQLSDAQHVVPGHPFTVALTTRSLSEAQRLIRKGPARV